MRWLAPAVVLLLGLGTVLFYANGMPWVSEIPGWFYRPWDKGRPVWVLLLAGGLAAGLFAAATALLLRRRPGAVAAIGLVAATTLLQLGTSLVGGSDEILRRHESGHGKYWRVTAERRGRWLETLLDYERLARARDLGDFAPTKPPGVFLPYMAVDAAARVPIVRAVLAPVAEGARGRKAMAPYAEAAALSIVLLPLLTALVIPALLVLGKALFRDDAAAWGGAVLWASAPGTLLVQYHLDGAVYPLFAVASAALVAAGARTDRALLSILGGAVLMAGLYTSFSLLVGIPLVAGCVLAVGIDRAHRGEGWRAAPPTAFHLLYAAAGFAVVLAVVTVALRFDFVARYDFAMYYHERWKRAVPTTLWRAAALLEYALYVGVPLVAVWLARVATAAAALLRRRLGTAELSAVGLFVLLGAVSAVSGTNEVSRMWLFLTPFLALSAATVVRQQPWFSWRASVAFLAGAQIVLAVFMKNFQEW